MTDPNQPKTFGSKKNGKRYKHYNRHQANERQVDRDVFMKHFEIRHKRKPTKTELEVFNSAYNLGYKEGRKRTTSLTSEAKE